MAFEQALREIAFVVLRLGGFAANAFLLGLPVILLLVLRPASRSAETSEAWRRLGRRLEGVIRSALWASGVTTLLAILLQALVAAEFAGGDVDGSSFSQAIDTSFGRWYLLRIPLLVALAILLVGRVSDTASSSARRRNVWWAAWIVLALALVSTSSLGGHAAASSPATLTILNDVVHLVSGSIWFTGVIVLGALMPRALAKVQRDEHLPVIAPSVVRFSRVALISIAVVAVTGTINSFVNVAAFDDLGDSGYGRWLSAKVTAFLIILIFGAINHLYVRRRFQALERGGAGSAQRIFRRTIRAEVFLALTLIAVTAALVGSARTRQYSAGPNVAAPTVQEATGLDSGGSSP